jgi:hypothetical protein
MEATTSPINLNQKNQNSFLEKLIRLEIGIHFVLIHDKAKIQQ